MTTENIILDSVDLTILRKISDNSACRLKGISGLDDASIAYRVRRLKNRGYILTTRKGFLKMLTLKGTEVLDGNSYPDNGAGA